MISIDEALQIIRKTPPSNEQFLDDLKDRLTGGQPIPLVPFVGAGFSIPMGFPSWGEFLKGLAAECGKVDKVTALLAECKYEEAAEIVQRSLREAIFNKRVTHTFGNRRSSECKLNGPVLVLPDLAPGPVVTTNFDGILERVFTESGSQFGCVVRGSQVDSMRTAMAENRHFLLKIHGDGEESSGRVITRRQYTKYYASGDPEGLRAQLAQLFRGRTLLFLGCSLGQDRTMDVIFKASRQTSGLQHFAILEKPALNSEFLKKQRLLSDRGILPIWYPTAGHDLIAPLLRWISHVQSGEPDWTVLRIDKVLTFRDDQADRAAVERKVLVRANRQGLTEFWFRNISTDGQVENKLIDNKPPDAEKTICDDLQLCKRFSQPLSFGDEQNIHLSYDVVRAFKPPAELKFINVIDEVTKKLRVVVNFHQDKPCIDAEVLLFMSGQLLKPLPGLLKFSDGRRQAEVELPNPKRGHEYVVQWKW